MSTKNPYSAIQSAVLNGILVRPETCSICNKKTKAIHGHHNDYSKILDVVWVCIACHANIHKELRLKGIVLDRSFSRSANVTVREGVFNRALDIKKKYHLKSYDELLNNLLDCYEKFHCPECKHEVKPKTCSCKGEL